LGYRASPAVGPRSAVEVAVACGVESMSRIPPGSNVKNGPGRAIPKTYFGRYEYTSQFEATERIATKWGITREECDAFGCESQRRAAVTLTEGRFEQQIALGGTGAILTTKALHELERVDGRWGLVSMCRGC
jgi:acetyl-CoA acetyltransferase